jgi:hypothetical protein
MILRVLSTEKKKIVINTAAVMMVIIKKLSSIRNSFALLWIHSILNMMAHLSAF